VRHFLAQEKIYSLALDLKNRKNKPLKNISSPIKNLAERPALGRPSEVRRLCQIVNNS
jgi:hypothetical protein